MPKFDMVIFDCDGVLVDSEPITNRLLQDDLAAHGLVLTLEDVMGSFVGGTIAGVGVEARRRGADLPENWADLFYEKMFVALADQVESIPGAEEVLDALDAAGITYAVGSNGPHRKMDVTLIRTGLASRLKGRVYSREDVERPKPAPDVYLKAAADSGIAPERCAVIEDSASGATAGKAAGMAVFGFAAETPRDRLEPICDAIFEDMAELPALLGLQTK